MDQSIRKFLERQRLGYVATISPSGIPNLSPKGTIIMWDPQTLVFADIRSPKTVGNILSNPNVAINVVDPLLRRGFRFRGKARVITSGKTFDRVLAHYNKIGIKSHIKRIVVVDVLAVSKVTSPLYDLGMSEDEIKSTWRNRLLDM